jgi:hypothetical protein
MFACIGVGFLRETRSPTTSAAHLLERRSLASLRTFVRPS